jgi:hypothetical protein
LVLAFNSSRRAATIDLASVRDTLLYIQSDLNQSPELHRLGAAIRKALAEIDALDETDIEDDKPKFVSARFLPAQLGL